uniref:Uncharacterized protein n=1 Tax=Kalanchoe fedtschenkoi TaxID=63787 RepID=A0A7N0TMC4_KALFE
MELMKIAVVTMMIIALLVIVSSDQHSGFAVAAGDWSRELCKPDDALCHGGINK